MKEATTGRMAACAGCHGRGACRRCLGTGHDPVFGYRKKCLLCNGSGLCVQCCGSGLVPKERTRWHRMVF
jgi:hypothetical protein